MATYVRKFRDSVFVVYSYNRVKLKRFTGVKLSDKAWDFDKVKKNVEGFDTYQRKIQATVTRMMNSVTAVEARGLEPTVELVKDEFDQALKKTKVVHSKSFRQMYIQYLDTADSRYKESTVKKIKVTNKVWEYFCENAKYEPSIDTFDQVIFGKFVQYMQTKTKMVDSTVYRHIKALKQFLRWAYPKQDLSFIKFTLKSKDDEEIVALTEEELLKVKNAELSGHLAKTRDLFMFCATTGLRYSDSQEFSPHSISKADMMNITQIKTGGKAYPPLQATAKKILEEYDGYPPKISNQKYNDYLKILFTKLEMNRLITTATIKKRQVIHEVKPLYEVISSHTARRTFVSICLKKGMPMAQLMKMTGHSDYRSMKPYMRLVEEDLRDVADMWKI